MSELPRGWVESTIGEVCDYIQRGKSPKYIESSALPVINQKCVRWSGVDERYLKFVAPEQWPSWTEERFLVPGDVLWNSTGTGTIGRAALFRGLRTADRAVVDSHVTILRTNGAVIGTFLHRFIQSPVVQSAIVDMQSGTTNQVELNRAEIIATALPLPPMAEQKRIVVKLDALNAKSARARTELTRIETLVSRYKQAVLNKALSGELTRDWRIAKRIEEWLRVEPEGLFRWSSGKNLPSREYAGGDVPVIGGNGVSGYHNIANTEAPTIVIGRVGALCGNVYHSEGPAWITDNAIYAKWIAPEVDLRFAALVYEVADLNKMSGGTGQPYVNQSILNSIDFPLPSINEQHEIVRRIESAFAKIDRLAKEAKLALELVGRLDEAILAKAFRGELVPQDENDEPADHLLARIRAERDTAPKEKKRVLKRTSAMLTASDFLNAKLPNWPREGISFQDLRREFSGSYDDLKDAVFTLLSDENALLRQVFDENQSAMTLRKREQ